MELKLYFRQGTAECPSLGASDSLGIQGRPVILQTYAPMGISQWVHKYAGVSTMGENPILPRWGKCFNVITTHTRTPSPFINI